MEKVQLKTDKLIKISFTNLLVTPEKAAELINYLSSVESTIKADLTQDYLEGTPVYAYDSIYREGSIPVACKLNRVSYLKDIFNIEIEELSKYVEIEGQGAYSCYEEVAQVWNSEKEKEKEENQ